MHQQYHLYLQIKKFLEILQFKRMQTLFHYFLFADICFPVVVVEYRVVVHSSAHLVQCQRQGHKRTGPQKAGVIAALEQMCNTS